MWKGIVMSQSEMKDPMSLVNGVCASAANDAGLKARLLADPRATLAQETGLTIPGDWVLVASEAPDGTMRVDLANENIPDQYLELVSGGFENQSPIKNDFTKDSGC
jgi:hypothetical protein